MREILEWSERFRKYSMELREGELYLKGGEYVELEELMGGWVRYRYLDFSGRYYKLERRFRDEIRW